MLHVSDKLHTSVPSEKETEIKEFVLKWVWGIVQDRVDPNQHGSITKSPTIMPSLTLVDHSVTTLTGAKSPGSSLCSIPLDNLK
jgi:hypothetical protein